MEPKEKAIRLCQEMGRSTLFADDCNDGKTLPLRVAKICALVVANEFIAAMSTVHIGYCKEPFNAYYKKKKDYWLAVKAEIEKFEL